MTSERVTQAAGTGPGDRPSARALRAAGLVALYAYLGALAFGPRGFHLWREWVLQVCTLGVISSYAWLKVAVDRRHRAWRIPLAAVPTLFTFSNVLLNARPDGRPPPNVMMITIGIVLACYPAIVIVIVQTHRGHWTALNRASVLDSLVAALAIWAFFTAFVLPTALDAAGRGRVSPAVVLAFPICDLSVLTLTVVAIALSGTSPERMSGWMFGAILIFALGDSYYGIRQAMGTWQLGTIMDGTWVTACALIGLGAGGGKPSTRTTRSWGAGVLLVPLASASAVTALLVVGNRWPLSGPAVGLAAAAAVVALLRLADAYAQLRSLAETQRQAATDDLTGLANRRAFYRAVEARLGRGEPFLVLLIDLDRFKEINDTLGHGVGDEFLQAVARRLESALPLGAVLARLGGDEFAACLAVAGRAEAVPAAEGLLAALAHPVHLAGHTLPVRASLGVAIYPDQARTRTELLRRADVAMYAAKRSGGGVRVHDAHDDPVLT